jgi:soluble cytochrome b562
MVKTLKTPVKEIEKPTTFQVVEKHLRENKSNAYTMRGIMVEAFNEKIEDIDGSFAEWKTGLPTLYSRIGRALKLLREEGKIKAKAHGKAFHYWWVAK